jgi:NitT/TauT family transport system substrate-binding protein
MNGPTGMGMAKMINDNGKESEKYVFSSFSSPTDATASLQNGELDMLCVPTNLAANLAKANSDFISVAAVNCLGSLYVVTDGSVTLNSLADLDGKTVYCGEPTSTTPSILKHLFELYNINVDLQIESTNEVVSAKMTAGSVSIAVLPEPKATAAILSAKQSGYSYSIGLNISEEWSEKSTSPLTMGCIIVKNTFLSENKASVDAFLQEYKSSIEYIADPANHDVAAQMIVSAGILPKLPVANSALTNLYGSIVYIDGAEMRSALEGFYTAIGYKLPADSFYYGDE